MKHGNQINITAMVVLYTTQVATITKNIIIMHV